VRAKCQQRLPESNGRNPRVCPLKALDSLYLACARSLPQGSKELVLFACADRRLLRAARGGRVARAQPGNGTLSP